ncbi:MAG: hypothetical protein A6F70_07815 [Cycloclasticus sp. symbiont of Bathymodiolus heckerae]|nr:MAG: hypothetical protein A6F70_07815 [Cycloclasticus sp. symbiont of Bathymodiolus heckerae]
MKLLPYKFSRFLLISSLFLVSSVTFAVDLIVPTFKANYKLSHNNIEIGRVELSVKALPDNQYQLTSITHTSGLLAFVRDDDVIEKSRFEVATKALRPLAYQYKQTLGDNQKDIRLTFNWQHNTLVNSTKGIDWTLNIKEGVLDKALMQIALMLDLENPSPNLIYDIADGGKLKRYVFTPLGTETINIAGKSYETVKLARKKDDKPLITYYWCAKSLHNIPVLLQREKPYGTFEMRLINVKFSD